MEDNTIKKILLILIILIILVQTTIANETSAGDSDQGTYSTEVLELKKVWVSNNTEATKTDANEILQSVGANTNDSPLVLEFTVLTNLEEWDLSLATDNGGKLLRDDGTPLKTDATNHDGSLGNGGTLYVLLKEVTEGEIDNVTPTEGADVDVKNSVANLAFDAFGKSNFESSGRVQAVFEVRAGLGGEKIIAPPGTYTETVTITLTSGTP